MCMIMCMCMNTHTSTCIGNIYDMLNHFDYSHPLIAHILLFIESIKVEIKVEPVDLINWSWPCKALEQASSWNTVDITLSSAYHWRIIFLHTERMLTFQTRAIYHFKVFVLIWKIKRILYSKHDHSIDIYNGKGNCGQSLYSQTPYKHIMTYLWRFLKMMTKRVFFS